MPLEGTAASGKALLVLKLRYSAFIYLPNVYKLSAILMTFGTDKNIQGQAGTAGLTEVTVSSNIFVDAILLRVSCLLYVSTLRMESMCSSEIFMDSHLTTWPYIPLGDTLHEYPNLSQSIAIKYYECRSKSKAIPVTGRGGL
jgi:hypothetical protein